MEDFSGKFLKEKIAKENQQIINGYEFIQYLNTLSSLK